MLKMIIYNIYNITLLHYIIRRKVQVEGQDFTLPQLFTLVCFSPLVCILVYFSSIIPPFLCSLFIFTETVFLRIIMGGLPDVTELRTRLENTLISYHNLEEKEWNVAKKSVRIFILYTNFFFFFSR